MENYVEKPAHEIRSLTNQDLVRKIDGLVKEERMITIEILRLLREIERRQLFAELGFPSLFAYCTKSLSYSEAAACRRIEAMRAMRETPEIESKLESGELSLSAVTQARTAIRQFEKFSSTEVTSENKKTAMLSLCGKSKREVDKELALEFSTPLPAIAIAQRETAHGTTRVTIEFTEDEMKVFDDIKRLSGRPQSLKETMLRLAHKELAQLKKSRGEGRSPSPAVVKKEAVRPKHQRSIPIAIKRSIWKRSEGRCEFRNENRERCEAKHALEYDHIVPVSLGGLSSEGNVRVYCRQHNVLSATRALGPKLMSKYIPAIR